MVSVDLLPCAQHITARRGSGVTVAWEVWSESSQRGQLGSVVHQQWGYKVE